MWDGQCLSVVVYWNVAHGENQAQQFFDCDDDAMFEHHVQSRALPVRTSVALWPGPTPAIRMTSPDELSAFSIAGNVRAQHAATPSDHGGVFVPLKLMTDAGLLSFISTTSVFGTPRDITLSELALEAFFPADAETGRILGQLVK